MEKKFDAAAFDIDGTLYPNYRFYVQLAPTATANLPLLIAFAKARKALRKTYMLIEQAAQDSQCTTAPNYPPSFYDEQVALTAAALKIDTDKAKITIEPLIYKKWEKLFCKVKCFDGVRETIEALRGAGLKTATLSDFPIGEKLKNLGLAGIWDAEL